jgi:hypothetical protein
MRYAPLRRTRLSRQRLNQSDSDQNEASSCLNSERHRAQRFRRPLGFPHGHRQKPCPHRCHHHREPPGHGRSLCHRSWVLKPCSSTFSSPCSTPTCSALAPQQPPQHATPVSPANNLVTGSDALRSSRNTSSVQIPAPHHDFHNTAAQPTTSHSTQNSKRALSDHATSTTPHLHHHQLSGVLDAPEPLGRGRSLDVEPLCLSAGGSAPPAVARCRPRRSSSCATWRGEQKPPALQPLHA